MPETQTFKRVVRLPYDFGDTVYHTVRKDKIPGLVTGFSCRPGATTINVTWGDGLREMSHFFFELTTEFEPTIE
jgi:hypothetical protein